VAVTVAATPLMAMQDPAAFARRARDSGARGAWAGGLRLLKDDPFRDLLARHGWLFILDPDYHQEVRAALLGAFPAEPGRGHRAKPKAGPVRAGRILPTQQHQPSLFEGL
jgi:hypothetical protein